MHSDREFAIKMGANHYLTKPFRAQDLFAVVETLLKNSNGGNSGSGNFAMSQFTMILADLKFLMNRKWKLHNSVEIKLSY
jgi:DNA-binding response OmpR family regulator